MTRAAPIRQRQWLFSSEAVSAGHPDKACDQLSDLVLDFFLERDALAKASAQTVISRKFLAICGEFVADPVVMEEARLVLPYRIRDHLALLYPEAASGFDWAGAKKTFEMRALSSEAAAAAGLSSSWGAQGAVAFGFACDETEELMPLPVTLANRLMSRHFELFKARAFDIGSDARCQVTVGYEGRVPKSVEKVAITAQHGAGVSPKALKEFVMEEIVAKALPGHLRSEKLVCLINPAGPFVAGGPDAGAGATGRRAASDAYGGSAPHGDGALSGRDPGRAERSGAYLARALAKAVVLAGLSSRCLVQLAYAPGGGAPVSIGVDFQGEGLTGFTESAVERVFSSRLDLSPSGAAARLGLARPMYLKTACFGHFGREEPEFSWEGEAAGEIARILEKALGAVRA